MSLRVEVLPEAAADIDSIIWWYELQEFGLGAALHGTLREIAERPRSFPRILRRTRRAIVSQFSYLVFFVPEQERVLVTGVFHAHRDPGSWRDRIREEAVAYV